MLFNSPEFIIFIVLVYCLYLVLPFRPQNYMLLIASYVFYGWWDPRFLFLVVISSTVDFWVGLTMDVGRLTRKQQLGPAAFLIISALVLLGIFPNALSMQNATDHPTFLNQPSAIPLIVLGAISFVGIAYGAYSVLTKLPESQRRICCVSISVVTQIGLLGFFKYFNFFVESLHNALSNIGIQSSAWHLDIVLSPYH